MTIVKNSVWQIEGAEGLEDGEYRLLELIENIDCVILFLLSDEKRIVRPIAKPLNVFRDWIKHKQASESNLTLPAFMLVDESEIDANRRLRRNQNFDLIKTLVGNTDFLLEYATSKRVSSLAEHAVQKGTERKKISRLLNLYWRYGQDINALLPAYANSGGPGKERTVRTVPLGAPKKSRTLSVDRSDKYLLQKRDKDNIRKSLKKHYLKSNGKSLRETYNEFLRSYFSDEIKIAAACQIQPTIPSFRQFSYWKARLFTEEFVIRSRTTERDYLLNKRGVLGSAVQNSLTPGSVFEIDATVADVHIVSSFGKQYVLGRPTIYSIIDRATRMIVGFHVSLYHASWRAARQALVNCFLPKPQYCALHGVNIDESDWPCAHVPEEIVCDNGEMIGLLSQEYVVPFTQLSFAPCYRPDRKSFVERRFKILNDKLIHHLLGTTRGGQVVRGEKDPRKDAIFTLGDVTTMLIEAVLEHNRDILEDLAFTNPLLIENNLLPTPLNCWKVSLEKQRHSLNKVNPDEVIARLLPPEQVSMTRGGIRYKDLYYSCDRVEEDNLASIARVNGRWQFEARIDDNTVNHIYVRFSDKEGFTKCSLLPGYKMFRNMPVVESDFVLDWLDEKREMAPITPESIEMKQRQSELEKQAKNRDQENGLPRSEKVKHTREHRRAELERHNDTSLEIKSKSVLVRKRSNVVALPRRNRRSQDT